VKKSFTLIELLVVLAIVGVLMSLLQPALSKTMETAVTKVCSQQMREINTALNLYLEDHNEQFWAEAGFNWRLRQWHESLINEKIYDITHDNINEYMDSKEKLRCPMGQPDYFHRYMTYGFLSRGQMDFRRFSNPSSQFILGDSMNPNGYQTMRIIRPEFHSYYGGISLRHNQGSYANILHLDGHVTPYGQGDFSGLYWLNDDSNKRLFTGAAIHAKGEVLPFSF
jgi:prepilin-type N-terminal cleavage/methylation domain-containing protein/prepilin-type processing-associated H-X9-DG protein